MRNKVSSNYGFQIRKSSSRKVASAAPNAERPLHPQLGNRREHQPYTTNLKYQSVALSVLRNLPDWWSSNSGLIHWTSHEPIFPCPRINIYIDSLYDVGRWLWECGAINHQHLLRWLLQKSTEILSSWTVALSFQLLRLGLGNHHRKTATTPSSMRWMLATDTSIPPEST